jgi:hypothetical protein
MRIIIVFKLSKHWLVQQKQVLTYPCPWKSAWTILLSGIQAISRAALCGSKSFTQSGVVLLVFPLAFG